MGNKESNESAAVKRQAEGGANPMYLLLDLSGGGQLFYITKRAMVKKDYKELDEAIKSKIVPFLYNEGKGKHIPLIHIALLRNRDRSKSKQNKYVKELTAEIGEDGVFNFVFEGSEFLEKCIQETGQTDPEKNPELFRECCWMVEKRGFVGESAFHICFLMQTPTHLVLARRLLKWFPKLINDIYMSEEYYGENVLHMSCVAEDPTMVKYLLDQGVNIQEKCYGNFFCPEDQKPSRNDSIDHEYVDVCVKTNYAGYVYWGEYSLVFAAVLNQEECFRLILSRGGNPDLIDTNGNTCTHIMVIYDNMKMFDLAVECGGTINTLNNLQLTPLTVAAYLARKDMFFHISNFEREVYWQIGNVCCSAYPIEQMDSINTKTGELNTQSALNLIVFGDRLEHLDLIEGIVVDLLKTKWRCFIKQNFFNQIFRFTIYFLISLYCFVIRPVGTGTECVPIGNSTDLMESASNITNFSTLEAMTTASLFPDGVTEEYLTTMLMSNITSSMEDIGGGEDDGDGGDGGDDEDEEGCEDGFEEVDIDSCKLHTYDDIYHQLRVGGEIILVLWSIVYLAIAVREYTFLGRKIFIQNMVLCPSRVIFLVGRVLLIMAVPFRLACDPGTEDNLVMLVMMMTGPYFLFFCRGFKLTGPFVIMIYRMMAADLLRFCVIYIIFVMGFAQSYFIIWKSYNEDECPDDTDCFDLNSPVEAVLICFIVSLGNFGDFWWSLNATNHSIIGKLCLFIFLSVIFVMLVNLLIAMMGDTYTKIAEIKNEWMRQWARTVLIVERGISPAERLRQQDMYAEKMATGEKALTLKQTMSPEQLEEIKDIVDMKVAHRKNINKRKEKFGYESNSLIGLTMSAVEVLEAEAEEEAEAY